MNKKIIALGTISIFLAAAYWMYTQSKFGRRRKAQSIIGRIEIPTDDGKQKTSQSNEEGLLHELMQFSYAQLEKIEKVIKDFDADSSQKSIKELLNETLDGPEKELSLLLSRLKTNSSVSKALPNSQIIN